ncbi:hypothetical protein PENSPDRAFT_288746 [Peniophora sp. CONT]|nr:hypothetical protein PENSPDRAFT_288746 [Peniophora sp. CONT]
MHRRHVWATGSIPPNKVRHRKQAMQTTISGTSCSSLARAITRGDTLSFLGFHDAYQTHCRDHASCVDAQCAGLTRRGEEEAGSASTCVLYRSALATSQKVPVGSSLAMTEMDVYEQCVMGIGAAESIHSRGHIPKWELRLKRGLQKRASREMM